MYIKTLEIVKMRITHIRRKYSKNILKIDVHFTKIFIC